MQGRALVQYLTWMRITQSWIPYEQRTAQEQELDGCCMILLIYKAYARSRARMVLNPIFRA